MAQESLGILELGPKKSEQIYLPEEKEFLHQWVQSFQTSLKTALLSDNISHLNLKQQELQTKINFFKEFSLALTHDLKSPLVSSQLLLEKMCFEIQSHELNSTQLLQKMGTLKNRLAYLSQYISMRLDREMLEQNNFALIKEEFEPHIACQTALTLYEDYIEKLGITVEIQSEKDLKLKGDKIRFENIVSNLFSNALQYSKNKIWSN